MNMRILTASGIEDQMARVIEDQQARMLEIKAHE